MQLVSPKLYYSCSTARARPLRKKPAPCGGGGDRRLNQHALRQNPACKAGARYLTPIARKAATFTKSQEHLALSHHFYLSLQADHRRLSGPRSMSKLNGHVQDSAGLPRCKAPRT